jgi:hypothetical protein
MDSKEVIVSMAITEIFDFWDMRSKRDNEKKKNNINKKPNKTTSLILRLVDFVTVFTWCLNKKVFDSSA